ncbi:probable G-protein coupled receptor 82 isoform X4 [Sparus aurata]|uniref:probable G-protein coupled receptor 82 isoform X4 n=1 Tax=Sparus aurata TaxID=8175 RepID=UPI0011C15402|nr:probable G-protein coupled receptor 82 isoform X4 [Sparus aurata]
MLVSLDHYFCVLTDQMELSTFQTSPPDNTTSSSALSLCPTAATLFFLPSVYTVLFLTALPGNALSLWVFHRCISTISPTHMYLSHLCISNLLLSFIAPFLAAYYAQGSVWTLSGILCQLVLHGITPVLHINIYISLMIVTWVALSRFAALIRHTHASRPSICTILLPHGFYTCLMKTSFASRVCAAMWVLAVGGIVPVTVYYSVNEAAAADKDGEVKKGGRAEVVLSVCLLPYHIFKPIFISLAHDQHQATLSPGPNHCHPLSSFVELKNCLLLLAALRGSTDPLMYFLLDKTFRHQTLRLLRCKRNEPSRQMSWSVTGSANQNAGQLGDGQVAIATVGTT